MKHEINAFLDIPNNRVKISNKGHDVYIKTSILIDDVKWTIENDFIPTNQPKFNYSRWHQPFKIFKKGTKIRVILEKDKDEFTFPDWMDHDVYPLDESWENVKDVIFEKTWEI